MIKDYRDGKVIQQCVVCGNEREIDISGLELRVSPLGTYEGFNLPPCECCGTIEGLNPDLPPMNEESAIVDEIPDQEWKQRHIIRTLMAAKKLRRPLPYSVPEVAKDMVKRALQERMKIREMRQKQDPPEST